LLGAPTIEEYWPRDAGVRARSRSSGPIGQSSMLCLPRRPTTRGTRSTGVV